MEYNNVFSVRAKSYASAMRLYPDVMLNEFKNAAKIICDGLDLSDKNIVINIPSAIDRIEEFLPNEVLYVPLEINDEFIKEDVENKTTKCSLFSIPFYNEMVDRVLSLACLHHSNLDERKKFYEETKRVLKKNGKLIIGDVCKGSIQEEWLNIFVNEYNSLGHDGKFFNEEDMCLLESCGFTVEKKIIEYDWKFESKTSMIDFCIKLFYLDKADHTIVEKGIIKYFPDAFEKNRIPWKLIYLIGKK